MTEAAAHQEQTPWSIDRLPASDRKSTMAELVADGLSRTPKRLPPVLFYDARGSELFEAICALPEYYVTRTERALLERHASDIAAEFGPDVSVGELGSGSSDKTTMVLDALRRDRPTLWYFPLDISESALTDAAERLTARDAGLRVHAVAAEYSDGIRQLAQHFRTEHLTLFLGGNLGNFEREDASRFLTNVGAVARPGDRLLVGLDLVKDIATLERAYNDETGVTAEFNKNALVHINRVLGGNFDVNAFVHRAVFNPTRSRIEMHLVSSKAQTIRISAIERSFSFAEGESIHTESSHKFTTDGIDALAQEAGWRVRERWIDASRLFSVNLLAPS